LLKDISLTAPNQALVSDITYIRTDEGFMYLALVMDAYSRAIVGYNCSDSLESEGALRALSMALRKLPFGSNAIHHSDRGCQYCSGAYINKLKRKGVRVSMTEVNHCYENSQAERLNGILKAEYGLGGRFLRKSDAVRAVSEAVRLYNYRRPHQSIGYRFPMEVYLAA
jgi:transposase InsO family protein